MYFLLLSCSLSVSAETFFPLPNLSESCKIEVNSYELKVKKDVQNYVFGIQKDALKSLMQIRRKSIDEGFITIQKEIDLKLSSQLYLMTSMPNVSIRDLSFLKSVKNELTTYPLEVSDLVKTEIYDNFNSLGI